MQPVPKACLRHRLDFLPGTLGHEYKAVAFFLPNLYCSSPSSGRPPPPSISARVPSHSRAAAATSSRRRLFLFALGPALSARAGGPRPSSALAAGKCSAREIQRRRRDSDLPDPSTGFAARPRSFPWSQESQRTPASTRPRAPHRPRRSPSTPPPLHGRLARFRALVSTPSSAVPFALDGFAWDAP